MRPAPHLPRRRASPCARTRAIVGAVEQGTLARSRVFEAAERVRRLKAAFPGRAPNGLRFDRAEHAAIVAALEGKEPAVAGDDDGVPEYELDPGDPEETLELDT